MTTKRILYIAQSKMELFRNNKPIHCPIHGTHLEWRVNNKRSSLCCKHCAAIRAKKDRLKKPIKYLLRDARAHAKQRGIIFDLLEGDIVAILRRQNNKCALSGIDFKIEAFSLDKINPLGNYTRGNVQLLTITINRMKSNIPQDIFITICKSIAAHKGATA